VGSNLIVWVIAPVNCVLQKPFVVHADNIKKCFGGTPRSWLPVVVPGADSRVDGFVTPVVPTANAGQSDVQEAILGDVVSTEEAAVKQLVGPEDTSPSGLQLAQPSTRHDGQRQLGGHEDGMDDGSEVDGYATAHEDVEEVQPQARTRQAPRRFADTCAEAHRAGDIEPVTDCHVSIV